MGAIFTLQTRVVTLLKWLPGQALPMRSCLVLSVSCRPLHLNIEGCIGFGAYNLNPEQLQS